MKKLGMLFVRPLNYQYIELFFIHFIYHFSAKQYVIQAVGKDKEIDK